MLRSEDTAAIVVSHDPTAPTGANGHSGPQSSWQPVALAPIVAGIQAGDIVGPVPQLLPRSDGVLLLYPAEVGSIAGEPEACKGWIALAEGARLIDGGQHVLYMDFEDAAPSIVQRLLALGADASAIVERFTYVAPEHPFTPAVLPPLHADRSYSLAIVDGLSEAYTLLGLDPYGNVDVAKFLSALPRPLAQRGAAVLLIDHVTKDPATRGRYALGAQQKLAGIAVAYSAEVITAPSRQTAGTIKLKVEKDRHGHVRGHAVGGVIALAHVTPANDGARVTVALEPPDASFTSDGKFRPTNLMEKASRLVEERAGASLSDVRRGVSGKAAYVDQAVERLITEGFFERRQDGQAHRHYSVRPFREGDDDTPSQPRPNPVPDIGRATVSPSPSPYGGDTDTGHAAAADIQSASLPEGWTIDEEPA